MTTETLLSAAALYAATGAMVGMSYLLVGLDRCLPAARGSFAFRPMLLPGLALLWPLVLWRWRALRRAAALG